MWYKIINAVSIITIMIGLGQAALPPDGWRDTMVICNGDNIDSEGRIASGGRDVLHQAWIRGGSFTREIYYQQSLDNGYKWGNRCQISNAGALAQEVLDYALAADPNGNVYCVWSQYWYDPTFHVRLWWSYSHNNGITWSNPVDITDDIELPTESVRDMQPSLSIDNQGRLHLAFFYAQAIDPHHEWLYVRYSYYPDSIGGWAHYETIDDFGLHGSNYYYPYPSITTIGTVPHVVYAQNEGADENPRYVYVWHSVRISQNNWQRSEIAYYGGYTRVYGTDLTISPNGNLHALWTRKFVKAAYNIHYARSLDGGTVWQDYKVLQEDLELGGLIGADAKGVHVISSNTYDLFYHYSIDGSEWQNPQVILQNSNPSIKHFINDIVANYSGRSVVFENGYGGDDASVGYFANDDTLLSDNSEATAYNWGRHLVRDPFTNRLHLVYFSQNRPHYTYSDDEGRTWAPYHIIENFDFTGKDRGRYPSIGLFVTPTDALNPCVAYISPTSSGDTLKYRWWDAAINQWQGFWLYNDNLFYSAPSITVAGEMVNLVVVVRDYLTSQYGVIYYEFPYYATGPGLPEVIEQGMMDIYNSPCITIDGNWDKHVVYEKSGDVIYMRRFGPNDWRPDRPFPSTPEESVTPFIEAYGDHLYVPYAEADPTTGCYDIFRRWRRIQPPGNWLIHPEEISKSPGIPSECPVSAWSDFTVWAEQGDGDIEFDLKYYWHPENRSGFISTAPVNDYYPHSQMYYDWLGGSTVLLTAWTKGLMTTPPYRIAFQKMGFLPPPDGFGTYYPVITGNKEPSFF
ncbi:MAG: sialidase family protein, partial [candidate division WOR-3 bacterium]